VLSITKPDPEFSYSYKKDMYYTYESTGINTKRRIKQLGLLRAQLRFHYVGCEKMTNITARAK